jgi:hypothetical protein
LFKECPLIRRLKVINALCHNKKLRYYVIINYRKHYHYLGALRYIRNATMEKAILGSQAASNG